MVAHGRGVVNGGLHHSASSQAVSMKAIILGKSNVGKTSLTKRYVNERFRTDESTTVGAAFAAKRLVINGKSLVMGIWDTAGSERYEAMSRIYYRGAKAAIVCYDISDISSFNRVRFWVQELRKNEMDCKIYLCGTKKDLIDADPASRQVDIHDATDYADEVQAELFETSSKTGENIDKLFYRIGEDYLKNGTHPNSVSPTGIQLNDTSNQPKPRCRC